MAGEDTTSSTLEAPPLTPIDKELLTPDFLRKKAISIIDATWMSGLPQWSWGEGVYLLSEVRYHETLEQTIPAKLINWYSNREFITSGHINNVAPGAAASRMHALKLIDAADTTNTLEKWIMNQSSATRAANGAIEHWPGGVWADTCYMMGTFLLNQGVGTKNVSHIEFIGDQLVAHIELLQNPTTKLFAHGSHKGETLWNYWGRGNAWMSLSAVEFLDACEALGVKPKSHQLVKNALRDQLIALLPLLPEYGIWDVLVDHQVENKGILETSASAGFGSAMIRAARHFSDLKFELNDAGTKAIAAALAYVDNSGILTRTSAGTVLQLIPFGYSVIRNDRMQLWGQGLALNAISVMLQPDRNFVAINN